SYQLTGLVVGRVYVLTFDALGLNGSNLAYAISPNTSSTSANADATAVTSATGAKQFLFVATATTRNILFALVTNTLGTYADVANVIVREVTSTLGPNLVRNGDFATDLTGWADASTAPSAMSWSGGQAVTVTDGVNLARLRQTITTVPGRTYVFSSTGNMGIGVGTTAGGTELLILRSGLARAFTATATATYLSVATATNGQTLDNVSVREVLVGLGPELVTNSGFDTDLSGWTDASAAGASFSWQSGRAVASTDGVAVARLRTSIATVIGRTYRVSVGGPITMLIGTLSGQSDIMTVGSTLEKTFVATTTTTYVSYSNVANGIYLDFVSVREVLTNQPLQPVTLDELLLVSSGAKTVVANDNTLKVSPANYPAFDYSSGKRALRFEGAATNLLTYSQPDANWTRIGVPAFSNQATFDLLNLVGLADIAATGQFYGAAPNSTFVSGTTYTLSVHAKADTASKLQLVMNSPSFGSNVWATFNLSTGAVTEGGSSNVATYSTYLGNGVWRLELVGTCTTSGSATGGAFALVGGATGRIPNYTGTGVRCFMGAAQVEAGTRATSYILTSGSTVTRVTDACAFSPLLNLCIPQMAATMAWRGSVKTAVASQQLLGLSGWGLLRGATALPAQLSVDGSSSSNVSLGSVIPGEIGAAFAWDTSGRSGAANGGATASLSSVVDKQMPPLYFGSSAGMTSGAIHELGAFVVWPLKGTNTNLQQQARVYT
ncbi:MAG: hypothetical protein RL492_1853, partial [Verrucomicrobiota bacterium]